MQGTISQAFSSCADLKNVTTEVSPEHYEAQKARMAAHCAPRRCRPCLNSVRAARSLCVSLYRFSIRTANGSIAHERTQYKLAPAALSLCRAQHSRSLRMARNRDERVRVRERVASQRDKHAARRSVTQKTRTTGVQAPSGRKQPQTRKNDTNQNYIRNFPSIMHLINEYPHIRQLLEETAADKDRPVEVRLLTYTCLSNLSKVTPFVFLCEIVKQ